MKQSIIFILIMLFICVAAEASNCEITANLPTDEKDTQAFILIGEQYLDCDMEKGSINFSGDSKTTLSVQFIRDDVYIEYHNKKPSRKDKRRAGVSYRDRLYGITYCHPIEHQCVLIASKSDVYTVGHEVVHTIIGSFHK